jgi:hypothetical protein
VPKSRGGHVVIKADRVGASPGGGRPRQAGGAAETVQPWGESRAETFGHPCRRPHIVRQVSSWLRAPLGKCRQGFTRLERVAYQATHGSLTRVGELAQGA